MANIKDLIVNGKKATRDGFGVGIVEAAKMNKEIVALTADLLGSLKLDEFKKVFPERFFQMGIAEANMMGVAAGMATAGKIPFATTFANFATGRVYDQIRQSIAYSHKNVKICASHAGLTLGEDGATHQILEDIGMMRMLPGMTVVVPCDAHQCNLATQAIANHYGPCYLRFGRPAWPIFTENISFELGKAQVLNTGSDITLIATGHLVWTCIEAAKKLNVEGISVEILNIHTIKPFDQETVLDSISKTRCVVTAEEHQIYGGLGDLVASTLARQLPVPQEFIAVKDSFGESGKPDELLIKYGLGVDHIVQAIRTVLARKK